MWYDFKTVYRCYTAWKLSGYVVLPSAGGVLDQDPRLLDDMYTLSRIEAYHRRQAKVSESSSGFAKMQWGKQA